MLRECRRVLKPAGRLAGFTICVGRGLDSAAKARAADFGPPQVGEPPDTMAQTAGLKVVSSEDVTESFQRACQALLRVRTKLEARLRAEESDDLFVEEQEKRRKMLQGIREGLLRRILIVCDNPANEP